MQNTETQVKWLRPATEYGPLIVFFVAYFSSGLMTATAALIVVTVIALAASLMMERRVPLMPCITAAVVLVFGGLTLWLQDDIFIKMKPTIVQLIFAAILLGGLAFGRPLLKPLLGQAWQMTDTGWRKLTFRFGLFFIAMAGLNEIVWRTQTTDVWVSFKVFGLIGLTFLFILSQVALLQRHGQSEETESGD